MSLQEKTMFKVVRGATDLSLEAKSGESLLIKDILIFNPASNYITCKTEKTSVGFFRVGGNLGNQLPLAVGSANHSHGLTIAAADGSLTEDHAVTDGLGVAQASVGIFSSVSALTTVENFVQNGDIPAVSYMSILRALEVKGLFAGYPVADGETFTITGANQAGAIQIVIYEKHDTGDFVNTMPNGSASTEYFFVNYGRVSAVITTTGSTQITTTQTPVEFPEFPFGKTVPSKTKITIFGVLASDLADDRGSNDTMNTNYIKLIRDRVTLFDDDKNGILCEGIIGTTDAEIQIAKGVSLLGNQSSVDIKPAFWFPIPLEFTSGDELNVFWTTTAGSSQSATDLVVADLEVAVICKVEKEA